MTVGLEDLLGGFGAEKRMNYSLDRFQEVLSRVGHPEKNVHTLVISGTNGKGTTALLVSCALVHAGFRVATYLSPHLQHVRERFLWNLQPLEESQRLLALASEYLQAARDGGLSYFEFLTLLCFAWAAREKPDFLVLEVGLGGRLDATNVTDPLACAVTTIDRDHEAWLGNSLEQILDEKLGVLRPEGLLFTGVRQPELLDRIEKRCLDLDAIYYFSKDLQLELGPADWAGQRLSLNGYPFQLTNPSLGTAHNAALAFLLLRIVFPKIDMATLQRAFAAVRTPGRMEVVAENPRVVLSGDHNPAGIACLKETLARLPKSRLRTLCAFSPDKPQREMWASLREISDQITLTSVAHLRDQQPADYARLGPYVADATEAWEEVRRAADPGDTLLVTGSLYLVGELRRLWRPRVEFCEKPPTALPRSAPA